MPESIRWGLGLAKAEGGSDAASKGAAGSTRVAARDEAGGSGGKEAAPEAGPSGRAAVSTDQQRDDWIALPLRSKLQWTQTSCDITATLQLPHELQKSEVEVEITAGHLAIRLHSLGAQLEGPLCHRVKTGEGSSYWALEGTELQVYLSKDRPGQTWQNLLEGDRFLELAKSPQEVLKELMDADEPVVDPGQLDEDQRLLVEAVRERQGMVVRGEHDLETSFDEPLAVLKVADS